ncbi:RloB family protein [Ignatzschineria cameli]|uniref:RloB domain-containing protein n=1 Tax=Ignatzschineria cameli TaxID=2182793 RepID=A0A2U2AQC4_9GAMM|nr:RloB family protein [Ignatzschineria cameli]PWD85835.1 hypothetical protein DC077_07335 [Ignatzschineria cameli]PWD89463.1 hypothetical protein DC079_06960 [Ignatzschineria cameli]PWD90935.1 hypothetical protein DC081_06670 [Ignatzschineria cameli]PWD91723.1 hypothetical protein DC078_06955 [Ignatzschineria cameli]
MSFRLKSTAPDTSRKIVTPSDPKPKLFFVSEGAETEKIYVQELSILYEDRIIGEFIFLDRIDITQSNQYIVVNTIDNYLKISSSISLQDMDLILNIKNEIQEEINPSEEFIQQKIIALQSLTKGNINGLKLITKENLLEMINALESVKNFDFGYDKIIILLDRDKQSFKEKQYDDVIDISNRHGYELGITNPCFELFLLLHLTDISELDKKSIRENKRIGKNNKVRFISKCLDTELKKHNRRYQSKSNYDAKFIAINYPNLSNNISKSNIATDPKMLKDKIGTSIYQVLSPYIKSE